MRKFAFALSSSHKRNLGVVPPGFSDGFDTFGLEGDSSFKSFSPTLKDGTVLSGDTLTRYNAALYWVENASATSGDWRFANPNWAHSDGDLYDAARAGQLSIDPMMALFRLTGDLRLLDRVASAFADLRTYSLVVAWEDYPSYSDWAANVDNPTADPLWSPYNKVLLRLSSPGWYTGTDLINLDVVKLFANMAEFAWALHLNRSKTSPGGLNYDTLADTWGQEVEDWVKAWSEAGSGDWHDNYRGDEFTHSYRSRADWGTYPVMSRNEAHAAIDTPILQYYIGRLGQTGLWNIANGGDALTNADAIMSAIRTNGFVTCTTSFGASLLCRSNRWFTGDETKSLATTYCGYVGGRMVQQWMIGRWRATFPLTDLIKFQRVYAAATNSDGSMDGNLGAGTTGSGLDTADGASQSVRTQSYRGYAKMLVFEGSGETHLSSVADTVQSGDAGGYSTPDSGILAAYLCVRDALSLAGDI